MMKLISKNHCCCFLSCQWIFYNPVFRNAIDIIESEAHEVTDEVKSILVDEEERRRNAPDSIDTKLKMREKNLGLVSFLTFAGQLSLSENHDTVLVLLSVVSILLELCDV